MRKKCVCLLSALSVLLCTAAYGQSAGSGGGAFSNAYLIPVMVCSAGTFGVGTSCSTGASGNSVLAANIKVPSASSKNVLLMASLESSLVTNTLVASSNGTKSTSMASAAVVVTPKVYYCPNSDAACTNGVDISTMGGSVTPNEVTFNSREQTLTANLLGLGCTANLTTGVVTCTSPETIGLILSTTSANAFNFLVQTPQEGVYQVQLGIGATASGTTNSIQAGTSASVAVAAGSLVDMIVQAQTPFDTITRCTPTSTTAGTINSCTP